MSEGPDQIDLSRVAVHTITCKPLSLRDLCEGLSARGFGGVSVWREAIDEAGGTAEAKAIVDGAGLRVPALVRGGFFVSADPEERATAIDENRRLLDQAAELGAEMVVIVPGSSSDVPLAEGREHVTRGLEGLLNHAENVGVTLALEPLHPMYAGDRSCVNSLAQGREICERLTGGRIGVAVDVYHVWWDPDLEREIAALGKAGLICAFHACDWLSDTQNRLTDRGLMGDGVIDVCGIRGMVERAGFDGDVEVEVIGERYWAGDQMAYLDQIAERCRSAT